MTPPSDPNSTRQAPENPGRPALSNWSLALRPDVVGRALRFAAVVGTILVLINHWDLLLGEPVTLRRVSSILLTYCVPYAVTTLASVQAIRGERGAGRG